MLQFPGKKIFLFYLLTAIGLMTIYSIAESMAHPDTMYPRMLNTVIAFSYLAFANFFLFEICLPRFRQGLKGIVMGSLLLVLSLILLSVGFYSWRMLWIEIGIYTSYRTDTSLLKAIAVHSQASLLSFVFFGIGRFVYKYNSLRLAARQLKIEKQEAELNYLKSQTNPHFLFNTLNNIYSLSLDKSDLAPESILRLSKILRFMLYDTGGQYIKVEQEVKIIEDYIALEKIRYDSSLRVEFLKDVENMNQVITPLLMIPLIENAFKHGVSETREKPYVEIKLQIAQQQLYFSVRNSVELAMEATPIKENIGLSNLRRQLALLYTDYELSVEKSNGVFSCILKVNLNSHV